MDAYGHINPIISIGAELHKRGHRVVLMTVYPTGLATKLEGLGFELVSCRAEKTGKSKEDDGHNTSHMLEKMQPLIELFRQGPVASSKATYGTGGVIDKFFQDIKANHDFIEAKLAELRPKLVLVDNTVEIPCIQKIQDWPWVRVFSAFTLVLYANHNENLVASFGLPTDEMSPEWRQVERSNKASLMESVKDFAREKGAKVWDNDLWLWTPSPYLNICFGPDELRPSLIPNVKPLPDKWLRLEHSINEDLEKRNGDKGRKTFEIPRYLLNFGGKLIYFSLGTMASCDYQLINRLLTFLSESPNKFIISMGPLGKLIKLYPNMWGENFVDQRAVLRKSDLFITHSGHNSVIEAFYFGVPGLITLPMFADQFDLAQRLDECGFGIRLNPYDCTQQELLGSIESLLANKELKVRMRQISQRMRSIKYHELAADNLEQVIYSTSSSTPLSATTLRKTN